MMNIFLIISSVWLLSCTKDPGYKPYDNTPANPGNTNPAIASKTYLALGDSYTVGQSLPKEESFPVQLTNALQARGYPFGPPEIIATTGWTTGNLLDAISAKQVDKPYDLVTICIGVNNQYQRRSLDEYREQFTTLLKKSIELAGNKPAHVIVLSIPDYSVTPFASGSDRHKTAAEIDRFNAVNLAVSMAMKVNYADITTESRKALHDEGLIAIDGLHWSAREYKIWTDLLLPVVEQLLK